MYIMVNTGFVNYLESPNNLTVSLKALILLNRTIYKQTLPILFTRPEFDFKLIIAPKTLKDFIHQFDRRRKFLICRKGIPIWI